MVVQVLETDIEVDEEDEEYIDELVNWFSEIIYVLQYEIDELLYVDVLDVTDEILVFVENAYL